MNYIHFNHFMLSLTFFSIPTSQYNLSMIFTKIFLRNACAGQVKTCTCILHKTNKPNKIFGKSTDMKWCMFDMIMSMEVSVLVPLLHDHGKPVANGNRSPFPFKACSFWAKLISCCRSAGIPSSSRAMILPWNGHCKLKCYCHVDIWTPILHHDTAPISPHNSSHWSFANRMKANSVPRVNLTALYWTSIISFSIKLYRDQLYWHWNRWICSSIRRGNCKMVKFGDNKSGLSLNTCTIFQLQKIGKCVLI